MPTPPSIDASPRALRATLAGLGAIALWAVLAALTVMAGKLPPFQLTAMAFAVGTAVGLVYAGVTGQSLSVLRDVPLAAWALGFCAGTAVGAALLHLLLETWVQPQGISQWQAIAGLGLGPLGLAFYIWDEGMKHGDILRLGLGTLSPKLVLAAVLVTVGAVVAGRG
jgi:drug/metabolite transporter (DMT)-like permease